MYILGVNLSHHASVCLLKNGKVLFYLEDDRLSGDKEIPFDVRDGDGPESKLNSKLLSLEKVSQYTNHIDHIIFASYGRRIDAKKWPHDNDDVLIEYILNKVKFSYDSVHCLREHHLYHAFNAFYSSGFKEAAALVLDAGGMSLDGYGYENGPENIDFIETKFAALEPLYREAETMYHFDAKGDFECIFKHYTSSQLRYMGRNKPFSTTQDVFLSSSMSCGVLFNDITYILEALGEQGEVPSWRPSAAGKTMGLSSYGDAENPLLKPATNPHALGRWFIEDKKTGVWVTNNSVILTLLYNHYPRFYSLLKRSYTGGEIVDPTKYFPLDEKTFQQAADLSKKLQVETKNHAVRLIRQLLNRTGTNNIVLSGGYFLNCVNNYEYIKEFPGVNFYIDPIAYDGGTAMGAARYVWHHILKKTKRYPLDSLFLG